MANYVYTMNRVGKIVPPKRQILKDISLSFFPGAKIGVLGLNGSGKSTLLKIMAGIDTDIIGEARPAPNLNIGYLPQEPQLDPEQTVRQAVEGGLGEVFEAKAKLEEVYAAYGDPDADFDALATEQARLEAIISTSAGDNPEQQLEMAADALRLPPWDAKIGVLSGGEKRRVALCRLLLSKPDMLLLDEPTNHLDLETREALTMALAQFEGTLVVVSHDRHLLRATTDQFIIVADGKLQPFDGDLDDYKDWLFKTKLAAKNAASNATLPPVTEKSASPVAPAPVAAVSAVDKREQKKLEAEERQKLAARKKPIELKIKKLEEQIAKRNAQKASVDEKLADPLIYDAANKKELKQLLADQTFYTKEITQLEAEWLEQQEALEQVNS